MAIYEYECDDPKCQCVTEKTCSFKERFDAPPCEQCGGPTHQIISGNVTFALKGSGWARDGYGGGSQPAKQKGKP